MDAILLIAIALFVATLLAFALGFFHYPYGWLIFAFLIMARIGQLR